MLSLDAAPATLRTGQPLRAYSGWKSMDNCDTCASVFVVLFNGFMSTHKLLWCYIQILTLQKPHIPASFNMHLVINIAVKVSNFSDQYLRNHWTLDIGVLGYIVIVWPKEHSPEVWSVSPDTPCVSLWNKWTISFLHCGLFPFTFMQMYLGVNFLILHVLLHQITTLFLYNFVLIFLYWCVCFACFALQNFVHLFQRDIYHLSHW